MFISLSEFSFNSFTNRIFESTMNQDIGIESNIIYQITVQLEKCSFIFNRHLHNIIKTEI